MAKCARSMVGSLVALLLGMAPSSARAWPADSLTQVQVSPANVGQFQGIGTGVGGGSVYFWQTTGEGPGVSRLRGLDPFGLPNVSWPDSGLLLETDSRPAQDEILVQGGEGSAIALWMFGDLDSIGAVDTRIRAQRFRNGQRLWGGSGIVISRQTQSSPLGVATSPDGRGGVVVAWATRANFPPQIDMYIAHVDSNGVHQWPSDVAVCTAPGFQVGPRLLVSEGGAQVFWADGRVANTEARYTQRFDWAGTPLLTPNGVKLQGDSTAYLTHIIGDGEGGAYYLYTTRRSGGSFAELYLCRIDSSGATHAAWPALGVAVPAVPNLLVGPRGLTLDSTGHVIAAWDDPRYAGIEGASGALWLQRFSPEGARTWAVDRVGIASRRQAFVGGEARPDGQGGYFLSYSDDVGSTSSRTLIRVQHVNSNAEPLWRPEGVTVAAASNSSKLGTILPDGSGGLFVSWIDNRFGESSQAIFAQHVNADGTLGGSVTATQASAIESRYEGGCAHLAWHTSESAGIRFDVERSRTGEAYERIGEAFPDGVGRVAWSDCEWDGAPSHRYRLSWLEADERVHSAPVEVLAVPTGGIALSPPSPMPMNGVADVAFTLARSGHVRLALYDLAGREVARLLDDSRAAGTHRLTWHARDREGRALAPGAYVLTLRSGAEVRSQRVAVLR